MSRNNHKKGHERLSQKSASFCVPFCLSQLLSFERCDISFLWLYLQNTVQDMHDPTISLVLNGDMSLTPRLRGPKLEFGTGIVKADPLLSLTCSFWGGILIVQSVATEWRNLIYLIKEEITTLLIQSLYNFKWDMIVKITYLWTIAISDIPK